MTHIQLLIDLFNQMDDEIEGIKQYATTALKYKQDYPEAAEQMYKLSLQEYSHYDLLVDAVKKIIESEELDDMEKKLYDYILDCKAKCHDEAVLCQHKYKNEQIF